jgi:uncharacterized glyoxalase superfamily protein PhnB
MKLNSLRPILWVDDVKKTIDWYVSQLGFEKQKFEEYLQWGEVKKDEVWIMFAKPNEHMPYEGSKFTGSLYLNTDDIDAWWQKLKDSSFIFYGIENFEYGMREFAIRDCNGYIIQFGQEISEV